LPVTVDNLDRIASMATLEGPKSPVNTLSLSADEKLVAAGFQNGAVQVWSLPDGKPLQSFSTGRDPVRTVFFSSDGQSVFSGGDDKQMRIWSLQNGAVLDKYAFTDRVADALYIPASRMVKVALRDGTLWNWSLEEKKVTSSSTHVAEGIYRMAYLPDGRMLMLTNYIGYYYNAQLSMIPSTKSCSCEEPEPILKTVYTEEDVLAFTNQGFSLVNRSTQSEAAVLQLWNPDRASDKLKLTTGGASFSLVNNAYTLASYFYENQKGWIQLFDVQDSGAVSKKARIAYDEVPKKLNQYSPPMGFLPNSDILVAGYEQDLKFWQAGDGKLIRTARGHAAKIVAMAVSPVRPLFASGDYTGRVIVWGMK
jgi:WD40 repeat protein